MSVDSPGRIATPGLPTTPDDRVSVVRSQRAGLSWSGVGNPGGGSTSTVKKILNAWLAAATLIAWAATAGASSPNPLPPPPPSPAGAVCGVDKEGWYRRMPRYEGMSCAAYWQTVARQENWFCWVLDPCSRRERPR
jgi:hypothetical protein